MKLEISTSIDDYNIIDKFFSSYSEEPLDINIQTDKTIKELLVLGIKINIGELIVVDVEGQEDPSILTVQNIMYDKFEDTITMRIGLVTDCYIEQQKLKSKQ